MAQTIINKISTQTPNLPKTIIGLLIGSVLIGLYANNLLLFSKPLAISLFLIWFGLSYGLIHFQLYKLKPNAWSYTSALVFCQTVVTLLIVFIR